MDGRAGVAVHRPVPGHRRWKPRLRRRRRPARVPVAAPCAL